MVRTILGLSLIAMLAGCGSSSAQDTPVEYDGGEAGIPDDSGDASGPDVLVDAAADAPFEASGSGLPSCDLQASPPSCSSTTAAPSDSDGIRTFASDNAVLLRCDDPTGWDFSIVDESFGDNKLFFIGEMHGSDEIGPMSAALFDALAQSGRVNVLAIEVPMDLTDALDEYVQTGGGDWESLVEEKSFSPAAAWVTLPKKARELRQNGTALTAWGVDVVLDLAWSVRGLKDIGAELGTVAEQTLLDGMPPAVEYPEPVDQAYVDMAAAYYQHVVDSKSVLCESLDGRACVRLEALAYSLYVGGERNLPGFYDFTQERLDAWFANREKLLFLNFQHLFESDQTRVYAHMGGYHAGRAFGSVAEMLSAQLPLTAGKQFTVHSAFGPGSSISYRGEIINLPQDPLILSDALVPEEGDVFFLPTNRPGTGCVDNPFNEHVRIDVGLPWGDVYDAIVWHRRLTPEAAGAYRSVPTGRLARGLWTYRHWLKGR